ncbi:hypothetical protein [Deinococcus humi]|uniref:Lipoprotein n=1 Tax=Deinococcus humi TaxID=662880 RepID=A0A7W8NDU5_9DEIO|nr:hypothetical protein [Deinococcus humi]MBB5363584.1 hypothetical protein [Deinococcus humi]GGO30155.1 hypothetical protein GCM10008949_24620 [Deinococcus humi]
MKKLHLGSVTLFSLVLAGCSSIYTPEAAVTGARGGQQIQQQFRLPCEEFSLNGTASVQGLLTPCGDPDPDPPSDETVLTPQARVLEYSAIVAYDPETGQLVLNSTPQTDAYTPGLVVVGGLTAATPGGVPPRRIISIQNQNGNWVLSTAEAALTDVIEEGTLDYTRSMRVDEIVRVEGESQCDSDVSYLIPCGAPLTESSSRVNGQSLLKALTVNCSAAGSIFKKDFDKGVLKGCIDLGVQPHVSLKIRRAQLESFEASVQLNEQAKLQVEFLNQSQNFSKDWELGSIWFQPFEVFIGPVPVLLTPYVKFIGHLDGSVSGTFEYTVTQDATYKGGLQYRNGSLSPINERTVHFTLPENNWDGLSNYKADAKASIEARAGIGFYVTVIAAHADGGVYAGVRAFAKGSVDSERHPLWQITAGPQFCLGYNAHLEVLLGVFDRSWNGERCGSLYTAFERHSSDVGPVFNTGVATWNTVSLNFDVSKGEVQILRVNPAGGETQVGYLTSSGRFDLTPFLNPGGDDTEFKVVGVSVKDWVYKHKLAMVAFADGQRLWDGGTKECGMGSLSGCHSKVEYRFNVNRSLGLFEPLAP